MSQPSKYSFRLLNEGIRNHALDMLKHCRTLVDHHHKRQGRRRLYAPRIKWRKWLYTGGEEAEALPTSSGRAVRQGTAEQNDDEEDEPSSRPNAEDLQGKWSSRDLERSAPDIFEAAESVAPTGNQQAHFRGRMANQRKPKKPISTPLRESLADALEWTLHSEDLRYAVKLTVAVMLVTWPAFLWNTWYSLDRGGVSSLRSTPGTPNSANAVNISVGGPSTHFHH